MFRFIKKHFCRGPKKIYALNDVYGCGERIPLACPTFVERDAHELFSNNIKSYNINVVYGESRQGKTWMVDRYCTKQIRIGCQANMSLSDLKTQMLNAAGIQIRKIDHSITEDSSAETEGFSKVGMEVALSAGLSSKEACGHSETISTSYTTVDINNQTNFLGALKDAADGSFFVFDNFHYLDTKTQQEFCSLLKEFNYQGIRIVIIGVWKDASRITALASDLVNRCGHVDMGSWGEAELKKVVELGNQALKIKIDACAINLFVKCCAQNIGIFKDMLQKFCQKSGIYQTAEIRTILDDERKIQKTMEEIIHEALVPVHDRLINLAKPQRERRDSKHIRLKIIIAILRIIARDPANVSTGIDISSIQNETNSLCSEVGEDTVDISNLSQELGMLHLREENKNTRSNFISLFFYDRANKRLLVLEPTIYLIKNYSVQLIKNIIDELVSTLKSYDFETQNGAQEGDGYVQLQISPL